MRKLILYLFLLIVLYQSKAFSQEVSSQDSVIVRTKVYKDSVKLRWAPTNHILWQLANEYGYLIQRYTIVKDSKVLKVKPKILLCDSVKPLPSSYWENIVDANDYAAIAAQAIYGDSFEIVSGLSGPMQIINKSKEQEMRFSYALLAADISYQVAQMEGLAFVDTSARTDEKYLYRIYINLPDSSKVIYGYAYSGINGNSSLPVLSRPTGIFEDKKVTLSWESYKYQDVYTGYFIERSYDSINYIRLNDIPYNNLYDNHPGKTIIMVDSLPNNNVKYFYRIIGIDAFGDKSDPSLPVSGVGTTTLSTRAEFISGISQDDLVELNWDYPQNEENTVKGFKIERSSHPNGPFRMITNHFIDPDTRKWFDKNPELSNYYQIITIDKANVLRRSYSILVQLEDSISPKAPKNVSGTIDSSGVVKLTWKTNNENDLLGYRVYRSNFSNSEFSRVSNTHLIYPNFLDSVDIKTLTTSIYYAVSAIDERYNESEISKPFEISKPDILKPVPAIFSLVKSNNKGIHLKWIDSSSKDVKTYLLYRKRQCKDNWELIAKFNSNIEEYIDHPLFKGTYKYTLIALDNNDNKSAPSKPCEAKFVDAISNVRVQNFKIKNDINSKSIHLEWAIHLNEIKRILIFRGMGNDQISLYKSLKGLKRKFNDYNVISNTIYRYRIQAEFNDGRKTLISEVLSVEL